MGLLKRLGFYLAGFSIGLIFLAFFFKKKSEETGVYFCYFPNCRTLKDIRSKPLSYSEEVQWLILEKQVDSAGIALILLEGSVDFGQSDTRSEDCKTYLIEGTANQKNAFLTVRNCAQEAIVESIVMR